MTINKRTQRTCEVAQLLKCKNYTDHPLLDTKYQRELFLKQVFTCNAMSCRTLYIAHTIYVCNIIDLAILEH